MLLLQHRQRTLVMILLAIIIGIINLSFHLFASVITLPTSKSSSVVQFSPSVSNHTENTSNSIETDDAQSKVIPGLTESSTDQSTSSTQESVKVQKVVNPINNHSFLYKIVPKVYCSRSKLVICAVVRRSNSQTRQTIRETWGSYANVSSNNSTLIFFLGSEHPSTNGSQSVQHSIDKEAELYGDILQEDYVDHYNNLSLKSVSILKWVSLQCPESQFLLKVDDDMYVNVPLLVQTLDDLSKSKGKDYPFVVGYAVQGNRPIRHPNSKWYTPVSVYNKSTYPRFTFGVSYAMTTSAAKLLYKASLQIPVFWLEDVYVTGILTEKAKVEVIHSPLIDIGKPEVSGCNFRSKISGHHYSASDMERIHRELYNDTIVCNKNYLE